MFKFNFNSDDKDDNKEDLKVEDDGTCFAECKEIQASANRQYDLKNVKTKLLNINNTNIQYVCNESLLDILKSNQDLSEDSILKAEEKHSDLLPAVYEGGLKIWECTYDLLDYLSENQVDFKDKSVLDLGCGAGILGIYSLLHQARCCWFQDYNQDVIDNITIPNIELNCKESLDRCRFFSGDWHSFVDLSEKNYPDKKFDYILTSETIYNTGYYKKLHLVFEKLLAKNGVVLLAAKSFYFGVGGGVHLYQDFMDSQKVLKHTSCWQSTEGVKREILKLEFL
ncbi:histidine protein methyltransferase 1 homolog isoform X1 [Diabrotica virgifera virgifera]|uniref:protein-histidine N-methyltransferase n=1 Tax=Diabrotica virgifera virgifera TaxID=50390 RepID=A0ABM5K701_DIAVI|nr:histidine protein methyltransferase 1 homolog isoform X1 [Diabrotica virgifera virgifera]